ncbi:MAG: SLBB domain-containing protein [Armatimonadetes bacterium]|nr:SLBB domain-containing protein [Armatimonadota bacterium]
MTLRIARLVILTLALLATVPVWAQSASSGGTKRPDSASGSSSSGKNAGAPLSDPTKPPGTTTTPPTTPGTPDSDTTTTTPEVKPRAWDYYPKRPELTTANPALTQLLDEIEGEAERMLPLYGQAMFRSAIIERALKDPLAASLARQPAPGFRMGPGDRISITFFNKVVPPVTLEVMVQPDGRVAFDPVGVVPVAGLTVAQFEERVTALIRARGPREATVQFAFLDLHALSVRVTGEVRRPASKVVLNGYATLLDALAEAGGPTAYGSLRTLTLLRDGQRVDIDLYDYLLNGAPQANPDLRDGDMIHVPVARKLVGMAGEVKRVGRYELLREQTVREVLGMAGGLTATGARLQMERIQSFDRKTLVDLDVQAVVAGLADLTTVEPLRDGDQLRVEGVAKDPQMAVRVGGAVMQAGEFGYRDGMTLADALRLAQGVARDGYGAIGNVRRLKADGQWESLNFIVAEVLTNGAAAKMPLAPGDMVLVPQPEQRPLLQVTLSGAVARPNLYETADSQTVGDMIAHAGGLAAGADLTRAVLLSTATGTKTSLPLDLTDVPRGGQPKPNPVLQNGDEVSVPYVVVVRVRISGQVRAPGGHDLTAGMTVRDLLHRADGRLPKALPRAELQRLIPGSRELEKVIVNLDRAEAGDAAENLVLREGDQLVVFSVDQLTMASDPYVSVQGAVRRPGPLLRSRGMRISDVIREVGLQPEADRDEGIILRRMPNGLQQQIKFSPTLAIASDGPENPELADADVIEFQAIPEVTVRPAMATVAGAVYRPGPVRLAANMTVDDLITRAGGFLADAFRQRVLLRRRLPEGRFVTLPLDMRVPLNQPVQRDDALTIMTYDQAQYREGTVNVMGDVQRPGLYERTEGLTVSQVLFMAGGLLRDPAFTTIEVSRPTASTILPFRPDAVRLMSGDTAQDLVLQDGDRIYVRTSGPAPLREVLLKGEVRTEGFYPILDEQDTLRRLIERARLKETSAFIEGVMLLRRVDQVVEPQVARYASEIYRSLEVERRRNDLTIMLSSSKLTDNPALLDKMMGAAATIPSDAVTDSYTDLFEAPGRSGITSAVDQTMSARMHPADATFQLPDSLKRYVRVAVDVRMVLAGSTDVLLRPNDIVVVPPVPQTVLVQGEVNSNMAHPFVEGRTVMDYIKLAGGARPRADLRQVLVVRADGSLAVAASNTRVRRGDMILVQPQPVRLPNPPGAAWQQVQSVAQVIGGLATTVLAISNATK